MKYNLNKYTFTPFPELTTERLKLRQLTPGDDNEIFAIRSNAEIAKYLDRPSHKSIDEAREFIDKINNGIKHNEWIYWVLAQKNSDRLIGTICLWQLSEEKQSADIGFEMMREYQGKGFAKEAAAAVIEYGFDKMKLKTIYGEVEPGNTASINLMEKFGFTFNEEASKSLPGYGDNPLTIIYSLTYKNYRKQPE